MESARPSLTFGFTHLVLLVGKAPWALLAGVICSSPSAAEMYPRELETGTGQDWALPNGIALHANGPVYTE